MLNSEQEHDKANVSLNIFRAECNWKALLGAQE